MWTRSENGENAKPPEKEVSGNSVIIRKSFERIEATEDMPEHWEYDEWQMSAEQYEVYEYQQGLINDQADALIELAEMISEVM